MRRHMPVVIDHPAFCIPRSAFCILHSAFFILLALLLVSMPVAAQSQAPATSPLSLAFFGGLQMPLGETRTAMGAGWNVGVAGSVRVTPDVGVRLDYMYSRFAAATATWNVDLGPMLPAFREVEVRAKSQMHAGSLDLVWSRALRGGARGYIMAGPTLFHRRTQIESDRVDPNGPTRACEPFWMHCPSQPVYFDRALGIHTGSDLGFNVGAGIRFPVGLTALLTVEARYFQARAEFRDAQGRGVSPSARFLPVSVGLTF